jgi:hypothetical protein
MVQVVAVAIAAAYLALSVGFWFWWPSVGSTLSLMCFLGAVAFQ